MKIVYSDCAFRNKFESDWKQFIYKYWIIPLKTEDWSWGWVNNIFIYLIFGFKILNDKKEIYVTFKNITLEIKLGVMLIRFYS